MFSPLEPKPTGITLELRNSNGKLVRRLNIKSADADYEKAESLWLLAYDTAYGVTETYDHLSQALAGAGEVGG